MKQLLTSLLLAFPVLCPARKAPVLPDSFMVVPGNSACISFQTDYVGALTQRDSASWTFRTEGDRSVRSFGIRFRSAVRYSSNLFEDCVLFEPVLQACTEQKDQLFPGTRFFIRPANDPYQAGIVPASIRFYIDTSGLKPMFTGNMLSSEKFPEEKVSDYLRSFYFRKYEVTNKEYREFVHWVEDSILRTRLGYLLPDGSLDRKRKYDHSEALKTYDLLKPKDERWWSRIETDPRKLNYRFTARPAEFTSDTVNVYPDTLSWITDFSFSINEPLLNMYFWHPVYDEYPVTGISYWQCLAFLEWKSKQLQSLVGRNNPKLVVRCSLPSELEWDYVSTAESNERTTTLVGRYYSGTCDDSWLTDLRLRRSQMGHAKVFAAESIPVKQDTTQVLSPGGSQKPSAFFVFADDFDKPFRRADLDDEKTWGDFTYDGYFQTGHAKLNPDGLGKNRHTFGTPNERTRAHYENGICWMDGNVSEWMREDVREWRGIFSKHMIQVNGPYAAEQQLIRDYEKYYFDQLPERGKLVRGSNWYDERFAMKYGKNKAGLQAKTFCDPDSAHCTLGFRYVIYLEER